MSFAQQLAAWRKSRGLTRKQAGKALGVPWRTLEQWEQARREPIRISDPITVAQSMEAIVERMERVPVPKARSNVSATGRARGATAAAGQ